LISCSALLFDMDGLMVDSEPLWFRVQGDFVRAHGGEWTSEIAAQCRGRGLVNAMRVIKETCPLPVDVERDTRAILDQFAARIPELELKPGCRELVALAAERATATAVASSSALRLIEGVLDRFALRTSFAVVISGEAVNRPKPAPDVFLAAAERLGAAPRDCVVLEDAYPGVQAARAAGMRVIAVPEEIDARFAAIADAVVPDLHAARSMLDLHPASGTGHAGKR
jgi:HAD superfamily hydrolase (TIGR01509 family)